MIVEDGEQDLRRIASGGGDVLPVTIVIPCARPATLQTLMRSLVCSAAQNMLEPEEILLLSHAAIASDIEAILAQSALGRSCRMIVSLQNNACAKRNLGVQFAGTPWVLFLDDDVIAMPTYLRILSGVLRSPKTPVIQGIAIRPADDRSVLARLEAIHYARTVHRDWGRRWAEHDGQFDPRNLLMRIDAARALPFSEQLHFGGEGHELRSRAQTLRIPFSLDSALRVLHHHRTSVGAVIKQRLRYGRGRAVFVSTLTDAEERRATVRRFAARHFGWTLRGFWRGRFSLAECSYALSAHCVFWVGFWLERTLRRLRGSATGARLGLMISRTSNRPQGAPAFTGRASLLHADCLEALSMLHRQRVRLHCIYFDAPFHAGDSYTAGHSRAGSSYGRYATIGKRDQMEFLRVRLHACSELLDNTGSVIIHSSSELMERIEKLADSVLGADRKQIIVRWRQRRVNALGAPKPFSWILFYGTLRGGECGARHGKGRAEDWADVWFSEAEVGARWFHVAPAKPYSLVERALCLASRPGDRVFDCFCGTGTVAAVCTAIGRMCIASDVRMQCLISAAQRLNGRYPLDGDSVQAKTRSLSLSLFR